MVNTSHDTLREAIARHSGAVISLPLGGALRHHKTRFLVDGGDGFWAESIPHEAQLIDSLIQQRTPVGLAFKTEEVKVVFATPILVRQGGFPVNREHEVEALLLAFPQQVKAVQRRSSYRVRVPKDSDLLARVWRLQEKASLKDRPSGGQELQVRVWDLSLGGVAVLMSEAGALPESGQRLRIELRYRDQEVLVEGRCRSMVPSSDGTMRMGVQFADLAGSLDGRQALFKLNTIVGNLSRDEVRRVRLGISSDY